MNKLKRYILFLIGLFINSLGVSLVTKANLGTSPISSIPYVLSLNFPLTLGNFTIIFSLLLIILQIIILRKNFKLENILQIPVSIVFGYFIDFTMYLLVWINPQHYFIKLIALIIGCIVLGFGVYIEILADVVMLPGESFVRAIVQTWNTNFGTTKIIFDSSMTIIAGVLSFVFSAKLNGVREGTVIATLLVGFIARLFGKQLEFIKPHLFPEDYKNAVSEPETAASAEADAENGNDIVTASTVEDSTFEADENIVPGVLYQLGDDEPVIRGVWLEGASSGAEFNGKPTSASDIRFIFENTEWIWIGLDTAEDSGLSAFIVKHQDDPASYTESFFANIDENVTI